MKTMGDSALRRLVEALQAAPLYRQYQQAFRKATGMAMMLRLPDTDEMPSATERGEQNLFCTVMNGRGYNCEACKASREAVKRKAGSEGASSQCFAHMSISALPVIVGGRIIAYLWTGQVFAPGVREAGFGTIDKMLRRAGAGPEEIDHLRRLWAANSGSHRRPI